MADKTPCWHPYDCMDCLTDGDRCSYLDAALGDMVTTGTVTYTLSANPVAGNQLIGFDIVNPRIIWRTPEPAKPTIDEMCDQAMARVRNLINARCAEHRVAIHANSEWDIERMHERFDELESANRLRVALDDILYHILMGAIKSTGWRIRAVEVEA